jgi:hypothetical protein
MSKNLDVKQLDKATLEFAIEKVWQLEFLCKNTKEGKIMAETYGKVQNILKHYLEGTN